VAVIKKGSQRRVSKRPTPCCALFADCVRRGEIRRAELPDQTEWYVDGWEHLYYCPFCGRHIKGKGFGTYDEQHGIGAKTTRRARKQPHRSTAQV
jgi:hypothetical protein